jgi:hypothetical protein
MTQTNIRPTARPAPECSNTKPGHTEGVVYRCTHPVLHAGHCFREPAAIAIEFPKHRRQVEAVMRPYSLDVLPTHRKPVRA